MLSLLPSQYAMPETALLLQAKGMLHEDSSSSFFGACAQRLQIIASHSPPGQLLQCSRDLVQMLRRNLYSYKSKAQSNWETLRAQLISTEMFATGISDTQRAVNPSQLCSLAGSSDWVYAPLIATAVPVICKQIGDTIQLREKLDLPTKPELMQVVSHLLTTVQAGGTKTRPKGALPQVTWPSDIPAAYTFIIEACTRFMKQDQPASSQADFGDVTSRLKQEPWLLVRDSKFVLPRACCFDLESESKGSEFLHALKRLLTVSSIFMLQQCLPHRQLLQNDAVDAIMGIVAHACQCSTSVQCLRCLHTFWHCSVSIPLQRHGL